MNRNGTCSCLSCAIISVAISPYLEFVHWLEINQLLSLHTIAYSFAATGFLSVPSPFAYIMLTFRSKVSIQKSVLWILLFGTDLFHVLTFTQPAMLPNSQACKIYSIHCSICLTACFLKKIRWGRYSITFKLYLKASSMFFSQAPFVPLITRVDQQDFDEQL